MQVFGVNKASFSRLPGAPTLLSSDYVVEFAITCDHDVSYALLGGVLHLYIYFYRTKRYENDYKDWVLTMWILVSRDIRVLFALIGGKGIPYNIITTSRQLFPLQEQEIHLRECI